MRIVTTAAAFLLASACQRPPAQGPPAYLAAGERGTVVVNSRRPARIPVRVLDAAGRVLPDTGVRFAWVAGVTIPVTAAGDVTCGQRADAFVRATLGRLATRLLVRCRPVTTVRLAAPVQFLVGDTARDLPVVAYGPDSRPVDLIAARVWIGDSSIAALSGPRLRPRVQGTTFLSVRIGDGEGRGSVHVYEPATTFDGLRGHHRLVAVPVRLGAGEVRRWPLPPGEWMLSLWPEDADGRGLRLAVQNAACVRSQLSRRRSVCLARADAALIVYAPWQAGAPPARTDTLAVRPLPPL